MHTFWLLLHLKSIWRTLNIPTRPCQAFIQHGIKIVCLNCYLGGVNTSGQQELKLHSSLTRAGFSVLRPHQHLIAQTSPWIWAECSVVWLLRHQLTTAEFNPEDSWHTCGVEISKGRRKGEGSSLKLCEFILPRAGPRPPDSIHALTALSLRHSLEQWWIPFYHHASLMLFISGMPQCCILIYQIGWF